MMTRQNDFASSLLLSACGGDNGGEGGSARLLSDIVFEDINLSVCVDDMATESGWSNVSEVTYLRCASMGIESAIGIEELTAITELDLRNNELTEIDISKNTALKNLVLH